MNNQLLNSVQEYIERVKSFNPYLLGDKWSEKEIENVEKKLKITLPLWYKKLLASFPIREMDIGTQLYEPDDDFDGVEYVTFSGINVVECLDAVPGCEIFERGYICIGIDISGSGDPFFISLNEGDNPPVYQVYHDVGEDADEILKEGKVLVSNSLSDFFKHAIIDTTRTIDSMKNLDLEDCDVMINDFLNIMSRGYISNYFERIIKILKDENIIHNLNLSYDDIETSESEFGEWLNILNTDEPIPHSIKSLYFGLFESSENKIQLYLTGSYNWDKEDIEIACEGDFKPKNHYAKLIISRKLNDLIEENQPLGIYISITLYAWLVYNYSKNNSYFKNIPKVIGFDDGDLYEL